MRINGEYWQLNPHCHPVRFTSSIKARSIPPALSLRLLYEWLDSELQVTCLNLCYSNYLLKWLVFVLSSFCVLILSNIELDISFDLLKKKIGNLPLLLGNCGTIFLLLNGWVFLRPFRWALRPKMCSSFM